MSRDYPGYQEFREAVLKRDKGKCRFPGCTKKGREVHHIIKHSSAKHLRLEVANGCTLCKPHHRLVTKKEIHYASLLLDAIK